MKMVDIGQNIFVDPSQVVAVVVENFTNTIILCDGSRVHFFNRENESAAQARARVAKLVNEYLGDDDDEY